MSAAPPTRTVGHYEVLHEIGRGGMAIVYLARQIELQRLVALKELSAFHADDPASVRRFLRESQLAGSLTHANIVTVYEYFEHERLPYISMEYARRGSLRPLVGRLTLPQATGVLVGVLNGLICAEEHEIVHRDLKPENLMLGDDENVKIADFGIARAINRSTTLGVRTATGTTVGTPDYMAPEQAAGQPVTSATDRYSVGVIAYELLTGRKPFAGDTPLSILFKHVNDPLPPPRIVNPALDAELADWIARLLEKDPENRIPSARRALDELEDIAIRLHGPRWRRLAALPRAEGGERMPPSKVFVTFDPDLAAASAVDESAGRLAAGRSGDASAMIDAGALEDTPVEEAERRVESAKPAGVSETEQRELEGPTIPPRDALPAATVGQPVEVGAKRRERVKDRGAPGHRHRWWWALGTLLAALGVGVAAASLLGGRGGRGQSGASSSPVSAAPKRLDLGRYSIEVPGGWSCYLSCAERTNGPTKGFRVTLVGPAKATALIDRYVLEPTTTLRDVSSDVLQSLRPRAVGQIHTGTRSSRWDYSFGTGVRNVVGSVRMFVRAAYRVEVVGYPGTDIHTILDGIVLSLRPKLAP